MYIFLTIGQGVLPRLAEAVAQAFDVPVDSVDVSDSSEWDSRNWDAKVFCEYDRLVGDLDWSFSVSPADDVDVRPSEEDLAAHLARHLGTPVLFPSDVAMPSLRRLVTPEGDFTYAHIREPEEEGGEVAVEAVERPVREFTRAAVHNFPELVRLYKVATPVTDAHAGGAPQKGTFYYDLFDWERLVVRMAAGWPPSAWYPATMYAEDLEIRDQLEGWLGQLPEPEQSTARQALGEIDAAYHRLTVDDGGQALSEAIGPQRVIGSQHPWYWKRRPIALPWEGKGK